MAGRQIRCVITGLGVISAIGGNVEECWDSILASRSGIAHTNTLDTADCYADYAAEVKGLEESDPTLDRAAALCLRATGEALSDAGLSDFGNSERASVIMGSCVGGGRSLERYYRGGKHREDILKMPISAIANQVAGVCHALLRLATPLGFFTMPMWNFTAPKRHPRAPKYHPKTPKCHLRTPKRHFTEALLQLPPSAFCRVTRKRLISRKGRT